MKRLYYLIILVVMLVAGAAQSHAQVLAATGRPLSLKIDSISQRADLTRVYCRIIGKPHTSDRIDGAVLELKGGKVKATDIDGVDFKRYFQWEDDGVIVLEIDFPPIKKKPTWVTLKTLRGEVSQEVKTTDY
ncbi:MAG: hypothetical protein LUC85_03770 [Bacteroidales bacterium]|nr:hypothetical protein [Bacteroidales bacterium]MCD8393938.1 hypothetical protein [Bacteroidales bacterium]